MTIAAKGGMMTLPPMTEKVTEAPVGAPAASPTDQASPGPDARAARVAVVVIGRNEGARLATSLRSAQRSARHVVYVDSGSADGSPDIAREAGAVVHELDPARPFSAARGRNEGFEIARARWTDIDYVQFMDGDCLLRPGWLAAGADFMDAHPDVAMLCGDNEEEAPEASRYNALCAIEWAGPSGDVAACGGNAMVRADAFAAASGYDASIAAGEEPELCLRLRRARHRVHRLDEPMTVHDADMHRFGEWWTRAERSGKALLVGYAKHGRGPERYNAMPTARAVVWGGALPAAFVLALLIAPWIAALIAGIYVVKLARIARRHRHEVDRPWRYAGFMVLTNIAEFVGMLRTAPTLLRARRAMTSANHPDG